MSDYSNKGTSVVGKAWHALTSGVKKTFSLAGKALLGYAVVSTGLDIYKEVTETGKRVDVTPVTRSLPDVSYASDSTSQYDDL